MSSERIPFDWEVYSKNPSQWKVETRNGLVLSEAVRIRTDKPGISEEDLLKFTYPLMCEGDSYTLKGLFFKSSEGSSDLLMTKIAGPTPEPEPVKEMPDLGYVNVYYKKSTQSLVTSLTYGSLKDAMQGTSRLLDNIHITTIRLQDIPEVREILKTINLEEEPYGKSPF